MIEYREYINRSMLVNEHTKLFVFGDNLVRRGYGGQAKEMRGEPNAVGIPTKRFPNKNKEAYLNDSDFMDWALESGFNICRLFEHNGIIVWPANGIGTGLAELKIRSMRIWNTIERIRLALEKC